MRVLVTGATGFVGQALCARLAQLGYAVRALLRRDRPLPEGASDCAVIGDIGEATDWGPALRDVQAVVHLAARAHVLHDACRNDELYFRTNSRGTERLAESAARCGVERFVFLSTIKVNGEESPIRGFTAKDPPNPLDVYGRSKWEAEKAIARIAEDFGLPAVIVRSPLVYGPGVRANFLRMLRWVDRERPLPLAAIDNRRSLVSVWNLCDLLVHAIEEPAATGGTWLVSDGEDLSTPELIRRIAHAMNRRPRLLPVPAAILQGASTLIGRREEMRRLCGSLAVDICETREALGWNPPVSLDEALALTVAWYRGGQP